MMMLTKKKMKKKRKKKMKLKKCDKKKKEYLKNGETGLTKLYFKKDDQFEQIYENVENIGERLDMI